MRRKKEEKGRGRIVPGGAAVIVIATLCILLTGVWQMREEVEAGSETDRDVLRFKTVEKQTP